jgi:mannan endo-1,4-beta-mannosidase
VIEIDVTRRGFLAMSVAGAVGASVVVTSQATAKTAAVRLAASTTSDAILTRRGTELLVHGKHKRLAGLNAYWMGLNDNRRDATGAPTLPTHDELTTAIAGMRGIGASLVRAHTIGISAGTPNSFEPAPGTFSDANLDSADWAIWEAKQRGILLMVPMTDQWNYYHGGKGVFVHWAYEQDNGGLTDVPAPEHLFDADSTEKGATEEDQFYSDGAGGMRVRGLFKDYLTHWLNHVNPYTGLAYKDDPTIAIIETGNELYSATAEWTDDIASFIKSVSPTKLVADGSAATGLAVTDAPGLTASHVDIVGGHYYAHDSDWDPAPIMTLASRLKHDVSAAKSAGKAFVIGEYPWTRSDIRSWYKAVQANKGIAADLSWAFIGETDIHGGSFGGDDYPVHWPYRGTLEEKHAPYLARHISAMSGIGLARAVRIADAKK